MEIPDYPNYEVSNFGRVRSLNYRNTSKTKQLKLTLDGKYLKVTLTGNTKFRVHQLVAIAFLNHTPCGYDAVIDHIDNNPLNNNVNNLQIISNRKNSTKDRADCGISWSESRKKWRAMIDFESKTHHLGRFINKQDALNEYIRALNQINTEGKLDRPFVKTKT